MRIRRGQVNQVPVTVSELTTLTNPYYLFKFVDASNVPKYVLINSADDLASADQQVRFNEFEIEEVSSGADPLTGKVTLVDGDYDYTIYEQASSTNIDPANSTGIVENGICTVYSVPSEIENKVYNKTVTNKVYNG